MYALKTLMLLSLYLDSFTAGSLLIFAHKCPGVIKSQMKYFLCRQHLSVCHFHSQGTIPSVPNSLFKPGVLWKIRENYVNDTAPAESREMLDPKRGKLGVRRKAARGFGGWGVATSSGISLGNLWIIPPVLMKVVRIKNAEIHWGQCWCWDRDEGWGMGKTK